MAWFGGRRTIAGVEFDHGLTKRQVQALGAIDVSADPHVFEVLPSAGISSGYSDTDARIRAVAAAVLLHPQWANARSDFDSSLVDLAITPDDDFDDPQSVKAAMVPVCVGVAEQHCVFGESLQGLSHRIAAARFAGFANKLGGCPAGLAEQVAKLFTDQRDFEQTAYNINSYGRDLIRPCVAAKSDLGAGWHPDPWAGGEYRRHDGDRWTLEVRAYGQEFPDRVGGDKVAPSGNLDATSVRLYGLLKAWFSAPDDASFEAANPDLSVVGWGGC